MHHDGTEKGVYLNLSQASKIEVTFTDNPDDPMGDALPLVRVMIGGEVVDLCGEAAEKAERLIQDALRPVEIGDNRPAGEMRIAT
jgi:hypothetical protein